jgi:hypothetical protein
LWSLERRIGSGSSENSDCHSANGEALAGLPLTGGVEGEANSYEKIRGVETPELLPLLRPLADSSGEAAEDVLACLASHFILWKSRAERGTGDEGDDGVEMDVEMGGWKIRSIPRLDSWVHPPK